MFPQFDSAASLVMAAGVAANSFVLCQHSEKCWIMCKYFNLMLLKSQSLKNVLADGVLLNTCIYAYTLHATTWILAGSS